MEFLNILANNILGVYSYVSDLLPPHYKIVLPLLFISLIITLYAVFIWFFYRFLSKRDIIKLNLNKYNNFKLAPLIKLFAFLFYVLEFIIIIPLVTFVWFFIFSILLLVLAKDLKVGIVILISASIIASVRITSYFQEDLSKDLAKMFPFTLLGVVILTPGFLNLTKLLERLVEMPYLLDNLIYYFIFILALEIILRTGYLLWRLVKPESEEEDK